jgi:hypothetical protein
MMFKCYEEDPDFREVVVPSKDSFLLNSVDPGDKSSIQKKKKCCWQKIVDKRFLQTFWKKIVW